MRILIYGINFLPEFTGIGKFTGEMVQWLSGRGHDIRVVTAPPYYPAWRVDEGYRVARYKVENWNGVRVWRSPLWVPKQPSGLKRLVHLASFALSSLPVLFLQISWRPAVVWMAAPAFFCVPGALMAARCCGAKRWLHIQDFEIDAAYDLGLLHFDLIHRGALTMESWLLKCFDRVSTISQGMIKRLEAKKVAESRRVFFPNWVDTDIIFPLNEPSTFRNELNIGLNEIVALYSGNMGQKQGLEIVIEAARTLESDKKLLFVMCGNGAAYSRLRNMAADLPNMIWLPLQATERLNELLNLADIHLLPQKAGAADLVMPSKLTGMLASGKPVVATAAQRTELWRAVEHCGINTAPGDAEAFADAIRRLAYAPEQRAALGENGRRYAVENWSRDAILNRFEAELIDMAAATDD